MNISTVIARIKSLIDRYAIVNNRTIPTTFQKIPRLYYGDQRTSRRDLDSDEPSLEVALERVIRPGLIGGKSSRARDLTRSDSSVSVAGHFCSRRGV